MMFISDDMYLRHGDATRRSPETREDRIVGVHENPCSVAGRESPKQLQSVTATTGGRPEKASSSESEPWDLSDARMLRKASKTLALRRSAPSRESSGKKKQHDTPLKVKKGVKYNLESAKGVSLQQTSERSEIPKSGDRVHVSSSAASQMKSSVGETRSATASKKRKRKGDQNLAKQLKKALKKRSAAAKTGSSWYPSGGKYAGNS